MIKSPGEDPMTEKPKILIVDDEIGICEGIERALSSQGFKVEAAYEGDSGLNKIQNEAYDLALIDVMLPGINGIELIHLFHEKDPDIVCIIITGYATIELAVQAIKQGAYDFLTKPFSVDELQHAVNQGLEHRHLSLEARRTQAAEAEAQRLAEETRRLTELDRAKKDFIRLVTHELQSPVSAIETYLNLILEGYVSQQDQRPILEKCLVRTQEERALISDLLELGHLEVIESFQTAEIEVGETLRSVLESCKEQIDEKKIRLQVAIEPDLPSIIAAPEQIKSIWNNLISNAVKYTPEDGQITIKLKRGPDNTLLGEVTDTGIGISEEDQQNIFTEFFRAKNAKALDVPGTGLGLVIVKRILDGLGGEISIESAIDKGSTFRFVIPVAQPPQK
jgi:signal transduction histidine kinase